MKTIFITLIIASIILAAFAMPLALAETNESLSNQTNYSNINDSQDNSTINEELDQEENQTVSLGDITQTKFRIWFTWNQEKKAEFELKLAKLRLIQARVAAKNNNTQAMEQALEAHERILNRVHERMGKIENKTNADPQNLNESTSKLIGLERAIEVHEVRIARLSLLLNNSNFEVEQKERIESQIAQAGNVASQLNEMNKQMKEWKEQHQNNNANGQGNNSDETEDKELDDSNNNSTDDSDDDFNEGSSNGNMGNSGNNPHDDSEDD